MGRKLTTVTVETDGLRDFVRLPTGERYTIGPVTVLKLVAALVPSSGMARKALNEFNESGQAVVTIDLDSMWELLTPKRARWAGTYTYDRRIK